MIVVVSVKVMESLTRTVTPTRAVAPTESVTVTVS
ncbi:unannotated protein [freshwater metagenome]|uniref:Unannotated protein n=1 Tax=freshwater metagenome TaxID=449393 RepID=A0A6J7L7V1_9ZZZZ